MKNFLNVSQIFHILLLLLTLSPLSAVELRFKNGQVFQAELVYDDDRQLIVKYRGIDYKVPKKDLDSYDLSKKQSPNTSYRIAIFNLKNGSVIKGLIAEEKKEEYVVKSELGFLTITKNELIPPYPSTEGNPDFPEVYRSDDISNNKTKLGISITYLPLFPPLGQVTPPLNGVSFFVEPAFLKFGNNTQTGFKFEYLESNGPKKEITAQSGFVYIHHSKIFFDNPIYDFYGMFGLGSSLTTYNAGLNNPTFSGTNPAAFLELGWQGLKYEKSFYRFGWKNQCFFEPEKVHCGSGLEISAGWNF